MTWHLIIRCLLPDALCMCVLCGTAFSHAAEPPPLVIAPAIEGLLICDDVKTNIYRNMIQDNSRCTANGNDGLKTIRSLLDELEPGGARGKVQVGYTITVQLLSLYRQSGTGWAIDDMRVQQILALLTELDRPAVLYLAGNHFDTPGAITETLMADPRNLMQLPGGKVPHSTYFGYRIVPYTLLTDESIPVNRYRFDALRHVAAKLKTLPDAAQQRLIAITLAGEVHHMLADFEAGMGSHESIQVTDYSPTSVAGFRNWLAGRFRTIEALNRDLRSNYPSFADVQAPAGNSIGLAGATALSHYDTFAGGALPVSGWLWDPQGRVRSLELWLDGAKVADIAQGFNRLDVYRAIQAVDSPNVGFRHDLDFSKLPVGKHHVQVVAQALVSPYEVDRIDFEVMAMPLVDRSLKNLVVRQIDRWKAGIWRLMKRLAVMLPIPQGVLPHFKALDGMQGWLDVPKKNQAVLFNPLARLWNDYRSAQVTQFMTKFHQVAVDAGLPREKLFSHQILPRANSSWNPIFFATDTSVDAALPWKTGINLYGGAAGGDWTRDFISSGRITGYGIPEFHPQQWKQPDAAARALALHQRLGARFISPYFMSVIAAKNSASGGQDVKAMEIKANNTLEGSDQLFRAIREMATQ